MILERAEIKKILLHRGSALLLDKVEIHEGQNSATGFLTVREEHCEGHFPGNPIFRGVLREEMMAQVLVFAAGAEIPQGYLAYFVGADKTRYPAPVILGDLIRAEVVATRIRKNSVLGNGQSYVRGKLVASAEKIFCKVGLSYGQ